MNDPDVRFQARFEPEPTTGCWLWTATLFSDGYARFHANNKDQRAHRYAYERIVGPVPEGMVLDHLCRTRSCVNPGHLEPVTQRVNVVVRGQGLAAANLLKSECPSGHPYDKRTPQGWRYCQTCKRTTQTRWKAGI